MSPLPSALPLNFARVIQYRLRLNYTEAKALAKRGDFKLLLPWDELLRGMAESKVHLFITAYRCTFASVERGMAESKVHSSSRLRLCAITSDPADPGDFLV